MTKRQPYLCAHCRQPCGVTGHIVRLERTLFGDVLGQFCPNVAPFALTAHGELLMGFRCAAGHTCFTSDMTAAKFQMTRPHQGDGQKSKHWREHRVTSGQIDYLGVLGYDGPQPVTKGQAHEMIEFILKGEDPNTAAQVLTGRAIHLRP